HGNPGFLDSLTGNVIRHHIFACQSAEKFIDDSQVALQIPDERNFSVVEVREIDAAAEHAAAIVFTALHIIAAQHANLNLRIEQGEVDGDFRGIDGGVVFRVEVPRIFLNDVSGLAFAEHFRGTEIEMAAFLK